ncbi:hypothetical protein Tco_1581110 [Tanacetum coccineum]
MISMTLRLVFPPWRGVTLKLVKHCYNNIRRKTSREYTNYLLSAYDRYKGRGYDRGHEAEQKQVEIMDKEVNQTARDSNEALLERFKLRFSKVRLAGDKTLDIASVGDVVLKTYFGTSWTLKDVSTIIDGSGDFDMSKIGMNMLDSKGNIQDVRKVGIYFCKPGGLGKQKKLSFIMSEKTKKLQRLEQVHIEGYGPTFIASI